MAQGKEDPSATTGMESASVVRDVAMGWSHDLGSTWPTFLDLLDVTPQRAAEGLHAFAWALFKARPPAILHDLRIADREDRIADLVLSCCQDNFRRLRKYRDIGRPFAAWLTTILIHQAMSWLRNREHGTGIAMANQGDQYNQPDPLPPAITECIRRCLDRMTDKCQLYLACLADGMKPREIAVLLGLPHDGNKRVADDQRYCVRKLREMLVAEGVNPDEVFKK